MKTNKNKSIKIQKYFRSELVVDHINKLFEITEIQYKWFSIYHPSIEIKFDKLLKSNHKKILHYISIDLLGEYKIEEIDNKFKRILKAYSFLFEISNKNKNSIYINNII